MSPDPCVLLSEKRCQYDSLIVFPLTRPSTTVFDNRLKILKLIKSLFIRRKDTESHNII